MKFRINELRKIIRSVLVEAYEAEEEVYGDTVMPGEQADEELLAEPDLTDQDERDEYISRKSAAKKKKARLRSGKETEEDMGDEHAIVGAIGPMGAGNGPGRKPYQKQKKLKPKNAMSISKALDEYGE